MQVLTFLEIFEMPHYVDSSNSIILEKKKKMRPQSQSSSTAGRFDPNHRYICTYDNSPSPSPGRSEMPESVHKTTNSAIFARFEKSKTCFP